MYIYIGKKMKGRYEKADRVGESRNLRCSSHNKRAEKIKSYSNMSKRSTFRGQNQGGTMRMDG